MTPKGREYSNTTPASLQGLLPELVEVVASFLEATDLCKLRMTCRTLYNNTHDVFWCTSLRNIQTDLSHASLTKLNILSNNPQLSRYVHRLTFKGFAGNGDILGQGLDWNRHSSGHLIDLQEQPGVKLLRPILSRLPNCKSFECCSISTPDHVALEGITGATDAAQVILDIVAETRLSVASFSANLSGRSYLDPRRFQLDYFKKSGFVERWAHLEELILHFTPDDEVILDWATQLILLARNVKKLNMSLGTDRNTFIFMRRLAKTEKSLAWPQLQELRLSRASSSFADLTALLHECQQTLRVLHIGLLATDATLSDLQIFFQTLRTGFPLEEIDFGAWLSRPHTGIQRLWAVHYPRLLDNLNMDEGEKVRVNVREMGSDGEQRTRLVAYSGPQVRAVLDALARSVDFV
ncbi:hypothetical protein ASPVEDRAFT_516244 [Aspergillus versicolor CBS 583.65]|uniref:Uncharacterized protein n=1 Tax=Aspergillus versicolor CBS 583.65 TaxID=1036611 RepID=A0A1L9PDB8_ASPVE|nr:uncharacterized protein ASPVEDRAFT_516244 [Aspergillus versicolor CBS 583.65]OJI99488.1 hypothetical protein ASPVEDRAFT_516244 [Aspergillus versicolor CBS 583.65]